MAKKMYVGIGNVARKVKKMYIGVGNIARKVRKAYIGIGGVARPCFTSAPASYGQITGIAQVSTPASANNNNYAIFALDLFSSAAGTYITTFNAYNASLVRTYGAMNAENCADCRGARAGSSAYVVFVYRTPGPYNRCSTLNDSLTLGSGIGLYQSNPGYVGSAGGPAGNGMAMFLGGHDWSAGSNSCVNIGTYYNSVITRTQLTLDNYRRNLQGIGFASRCLFGGGYKEQAGNTASPDVFTYDSALTRTALTALTNFNIGCWASNSNYAISSNGDVYNTSFVKQTSVSIYTGSDTCTGLSSDNFAVFAGGYSSPNTLNTVVIFDINLVRTTPFTLSYPRFSGSSAIIGDYGIIAGGYAGGINTSTAEAIILK